MKRLDDLAGKLTAIKPSLEAESVLRALGEWHALKRQWAQAAARFNLLLEADQRDNSWAITQDLLEAGPIQIELGDMQGYEHFRRAAIARYLDTTDPVFAERTLKICLLTPADSSLMKSLGILTDVSANSMNDEQQDPFTATMSAWRCISLALMAYRQGHSPTAKMWCQRCLAYPEDNPCRISTAHIIQAMACYQLGEVETAHSELAQGRVWSRPSLPGSWMREMARWGFGMIGFLTGYCSAKPKS